MMIARVLWVEVPVHVGDNDRTVCVNGADWEGQEGKLGRN